MVSAMARFLVVIPCGVVSVKVTSDYQVRMVGDLI